MKLQFADSNSFRELKVASTGRINANRISVWCLVLRLAAIAMTCLAGTAALADQAEELADGETLWEYCAFCHNADGLGQQRSDAPKLAGDQAWYTERQLRNFRTRVRGYHPEDIPGLSMAVYATPLFNDDAIRNVAAYIESLPAEPANPSPDRMRNRPRERPYQWDSQFASSVTPSEPDITVGEKLYQGCAACHGKNAEGIRELNAPRIDNKQDWYLTRQLKYFMYGARGTHEDDEFGRQMAEQLGLESDQDIADVVAYLMSISKGPMY